METEEIDGLAMEEIRSRLEALAAQARALSDEMLRSDPDAFDKTDIEPE